MNSTAGPARRGNIALVVNKKRLSEHRNEFLFWQSQSYEARLAALEALRREYYGWTDDTEPRLQRVCRIAKRE
jgi:hypothetical protein